MRGIKALFATTALLAGLTIAPAVQAQLVINIGVQPTCAYGYYDYRPYACAPSGYYGQGYFYNGIFLGMGPWAGWGYGHGWGSHRFVNDGGGSYHGGGGLAANRAYGHGAPAVHRSGGSVVRTSSAVRTSGGAVKAGAARPSAAHTAPHATPQSNAGGSHGGASAQAHGGGGGDSHAGGGEHH